MITRNRSTFQRAMITLSVVVMLLTGTFGWLAVSAPKAEAATASCSGGRCTVWLSKAETAALGRSVFPSPPSFLPPVLKVAYWALVSVHSWIAKQYASRGMCSGFRLSIYPWESQGYFGYSC